MRCLPERTMCVVLCVMHGVTLAEASPASRMQTVSPEAFQVLIQFYEYDRDIPLDVRIVQREEQANCVRERIVFRGVRDSRVPGYLAIPKTGSAPYPCILLIHPFDASKDCWWVNVDLPQFGKWLGKTLTESLLSSGFAVMALDAQYHGERMVNNDYEPPIAIIFQHRRMNRFREMVLQSTIDYRRAMDYLATRSEIDVDRIGALGSSLGGMMSFPLAAVDERIKAVVSCVGGPIHDSCIAQWGCGETARLRTIPIAPQHFAPAIEKVHFLMINGDDDRYFPPEEARGLYELIPSSSKEIIFMNSGHGLPVEHIASAVSWFDRHLK